MLTLYGATGAGSVAPQALLVHLDIAHQLALIDLDADEHHSAEFLAINPRGQIPTLVLEDGTVLTESLAIMLHIADMRPHSGLMPAAGSSQRALAWRWLAFCATNVYEGLLRMLYPDKYTTGEDHAAVVDSADQYLHQAFGILDQSISPSGCLVGDKPASVEIYLAMLLTWYEHPQRLFGEYPGLERLLRATLALDGVGTVFSDNELLEPLALADL